jgi:hypothetical protein
VVQSARVFTLGDPTYFVGVVALVNSLRITGSRLPVVVLDLGFTPEQRRVLEPHCELFVAPRTDAPTLAKLTAARASDTETIVLVDSDIVVTGPLDHSVSEADAGQVFAFVDRPAPDRWFGEWQEIFALPSPPRRQPSANAGYVAFSKRHVPGLLESWNDCIDRVAPRLARARATGYPDPVWLTDQDALNAVLMTLVPADRMSWGTPRGMVMGEGPLAAVDVVDVDRLQCEWAGEPVTLLHAIGRPKPWQAGSRWRYRQTAYTRCLRRALVGPDVEIRVADEHLPAWLRPGFVGTATGVALHAYYAPVRRSRRFRRRIGLSPLRRGARERELRPPLRP